jgi:hypothetical protein
MLSRQLPHLEAEWLSANGAGEETLAFVRALRDEANGLC